MSDIKDPLKSGFVLKAIRTIKGKKAKKFADELGIAPPTVSRLENDITEISMTSLKAYAQSINIPMSAVMFAIEKMQDFDATASTDEKNKLETMPMVFDDHTVGILKNIIAIAQIQQFNE